MIKIQRHVYDENSADARELLPAGRYLVEVVAALEDPGEHHLTLRYSVLASDAPACPTGCVSDEKFYLSPAAQWRLAILLKRLGLQDRGKSTESAEFDPIDIVGQRLVVDVIHEQLTTQKGDPYTVHKWDKSGFRSSEDPRVAEFMAAVRVPSIRQPARHIPAAPNGARQTVMAGADPEV